MYRYPAEVLHCCPPGFWASQLPPITVLLAIGPRLRCRRRRRPDPGCFGNSPRRKAWCDFTRPGKHTKNYGKSQFLMGKSTISMAIFNSHVCLPEGATPSQ